MISKTKLLAAAAVLALPALAAAQQPAPPPLSGPGPTQPPAAVPPVPSGLATQQPADPTETEAQLPENQAVAPPAQETDGTTAQQAPPPASPPAAPPPQPAPGTQAQTAPPAAAGPVRQATAADLRDGVQVRDPQGGLVGTIEAADTASAVVNTGTARARIALSAFGHNNQGLVISMTKAQLEAAVAAASPGA